MNNPFTQYIIKFLGLFAGLYVFFVGCMGVVTPGGVYVQFADKHLNFIAAYRQLLFACARQMLHILHFKTMQVNPYVLRIVGANGVRMVWSCLGFAIISFWLAFVWANQGVLKQRLWWSLLGVLVITCLNILRIVLLLIAVNKHWKTPFNIDHHSLFNICAYGVILVLIFAYKKRLPTSPI